MNEYLIMRSDLSSYLCIDGKPIIYSDITLAIKTARNFCGVAVPKEKAVKLLEENNDGKE